MPQQHRNRNRRQKKRAPSNRRKTRNLITLIGDNEPQSFPFTTARTIVPRCVRFFIPGLSTDVGGNLNHRFSLRNLSRAWNGAGTYSDAPELSQVFDTYKPVRFRIKTVPAFAISNFATPSMVLCVDYEDNDTSQVVNTVVAANQYEERKVIDPRYMTETLFKIPMLQSGSIPGSVTTDPATIQAGGFLDFAAPPFDGVVYLVGGNFPANFPVCDVYLEMDILCRFGR